MERAVMGGLDEAGSAQKLRMTGWTWEGADVIELSGKVAELYGKLPLFSRQPFRAGGEENRYKDEIRREPLKIDEDPVPVATVSKTYSLIQHRELLASVFRALKMIKIDISELPSSLLLSVYGERMQWSCNIPAIDFDPGDRCPVVLQVNCLNSVDTSTVCEIAFGWFRLVCSNGMMFGIKETSLRRRHIQSLDPLDIAEYLKGQLEGIPAETSLYTQWLKQPVQHSHLSDWVDDEVADDWGPHAAARTWNIMVKGLDGDVEPTKGLKPHQLPVTPRCEVPGSFAPVENLFHASQALSWIAGTRQTIQERLEYLRNIPRLMKPLERRVHERC